MLKEEKRINRSKKSFIKSRRRERSTSQNCSLPIEIESNFDPLQYRHLVNLMHISLVFLSSPALMYGS